MSRYLDVEISNKKLPPIGDYWQHTLLPLHEALQPVMSQFDQLGRSIHEAKNQCCYPSKHNLTREESAAVFLYTMDCGDNSFYKVLNEALRSENRRALRSWFGFLKLFDTALAKLPNVQDCVWRGVNGNISQQFKKGETVTWWNVSSCSVSVKVIQNFLESDKNVTFFMIEAKKAKYISGYTSFPDEEEVLLAPGTQLYVKDNSLNSHGGLHVVHLVELRDDHEAQLSTGMSSMNLSSQSGNKGAFGKYKIHLFIKHYCI
jgi:hypothetical protein